MAASWQWENATAGAVAGFATVAAMHSLDVVRTRFQVNDGRGSSLPTYKNTAHAVFTIARLEGLRGLYAGFFPAVIGSTVSWGLYFFFYGRAKQRYARGRDDEKLSPALHLASAAEAGALVSLTGAINISFLLCFFDLSIKGMMLSGLFMHKSYLACQNKVTASDTSSSNSTILRAIRCL
jgi:hypothetical protein